MNAIKAAHKLMADAPSSEEAKTLARLVLTLESNEVFELGRLYALDHKPSALRSKFSKRGALAGPLKVWRSCSTCHVKSIGCLCPRHGLGRPQLRNRKARWGWRGCGRMRPGAVVRRRLTTMRTDRRGDNHRPMPLPVGDGAHMPASG